MKREYVEKLFAYEHLPSHLQSTSRAFHDTAMMILSLPQNPEQTIALRLLLQAKDAAVRCKVIGTVLPEWTTHLPAPTTEKIYTRDA